tara:strand:- start:357 stop:1643 length:1287 start_codon:yes stop_codon:yes gene_type:complete
MGIIKNFTNLFKRNYNPENPKNNIIPPLDYGENTSAGIGVSENNSLTLAAVWACVRTLSESIASLPINVYKRDMKTGGRDIAYSHPIYNLLHNAPEKNMTSFSWFNTMMLNLCLYGNAYAYISRDNKMRPINLAILDPSKVKIKLVNGEKFYVCDKEGKKETYSDDEVIHILGLSCNGYVGKSPIAAARENIGIGIATQKYGGAFFGNGASLSGVLQHPSTLSKEAMERLAFTWNQKYANNGGSNAHKTAILEEGMTFKNISIPPNDAQFIETRKFSVIEICRIFRVQPHLVMSLDAATYSNIEQQSLEFVKYTLYPYLRNWEQELNKKLFKENEKSRMYCEFKVDGLLRGDSKSRSEFYRTLWNLGVISQNEIRRFENLNAIEGGDKYYIPLNMTPSDAPKEPTESVETIKVDEEKSKKVNKRKKKK